MTTELLEQMGRVVVAQSDLIDRLTTLVMSDRETVGELAGAVTRLQDEQAELRDELLTQSRGIETVSRFAHSLLDRLNGHIAREQEARV